ncbi:hypothetical protein Hanom_Chr04g00321971 [Helianthus anomalus]
MYKSKLNDLNNATTCNIIQALIYRKYQWCIHHACISLLKSLTQTNHQCKLPMSKPFVKCLCENHVKMFMSKCL